ncbi:hypothetical protein CDAR_404691 [Caerostris darwini]|uniref:Uncharacterized protein n=1 Tax=Caerostris darwini TaxID=1538125 RepID=A0AAV4U4X5_9ARAC|nr:hypothetical protein CDAR_404691 [Caerostris darwini]
MRLRLAIYNLEKQRTQISRSLYLCATPPGFVMLRSSSINIPRKSHNEAKRLIKQQKWKSKNPPLHWALDCRCYVTCELYALVNISISRLRDQRRRLAASGPPSGATEKNKKGIKFRLVPLPALGLFSHDATPVREGTTMCDKFTFTTSPGFDDFNGSFKSLSVVLHNTSGISTFVVIFRIPSQRNSFGNRINAKETLYPKPLMGTANQLAMP